MFEHKQYFNHISLIKVLHGLLNFHPAPTRNLPVNLFLGFQIPVLSCILRHYEKSLENLVNIQNISDTFGERSKSFLMDFIQLSMNSNKLFEIQSNKSQEFDS